MPAKSPERAAAMSSSDARRLFLSAQQLMADPARRAGPRVVQRLIEDLGFVQVDSIQVVARAHHLILHSRLDGYRPEHLRRLLERDRSVFEHWTHDAAIVPVRWLPQWRERFERDRVRLRQNAWWRRLLGDDADRVLAATLARITREGPLRSQDFEHPEKRTPWWGWKPAKAALDFLWRCGDLAVVRREGFQKVYDLAERVLPDLRGHAVVSREEHVAWACASAAERLVVFTPTELARFWAAASLGEARAWCARGLARGALEAVDVGSLAGLPPARSLALHDWSKRVRDAGEPPDRMRLLAPFDPVVRDRARALRRFGLDFRFEAFVPPSERRFGYFVMPVLERDRIVGRADLKNHASRRALEVRRLAWEPGVRSTQTRRRRLEKALWRLASLVGAETLVGVPRGKRS